MFFFFARGYAIVILMRTSPHHHGFTLIELSIVLVIIGLIVGGVMVGRDMIRASEIRNVLKEAETIQSAVNAFRLKYNGLPGDMLDAESIWGSDASCPNTPTNTIAKTATCNGNGNGRIGDADAAGNASDLTERFRAWQQLANAGVIGGTFTGVAGPASTQDSVIGVNIPAIKISNAACGFGFYQSTGNTVWYPVAPRHIMGCGLRVAPNYHPSGPIFSPADLLSLDQKADDGLPASGNIMSFKSTSSYNSNCTTSDTPSAARYDTSRTSMICTPNFLLRGF